MGSMNNSLESMKTLKFDIESTDVEDISSALQEKEEMTA